MVPRWFNSTCAYHFLSKATREQVKKLVCVCCDKPIETDYRDFDRPQDLEDGTQGFFTSIIGRISAGYGSTLDGGVYIINICDDCINKKVEEDKVIYLGDYLTSVEHHNKVTNLNKIDEEEDK